MLRPRGGTPTSPALLWPVRGVSRRGALDDSFFVYNDEHRLLPPGDRGRLPFVLRAAPLACYSSEGRDHRRAECRPSVAITGAEPAYLMRSTWAVHASPRSSRIPCHPRRPDGAVGARPRRVLASATFAAGRDFLLGDGAERELERKEEKERAAAAQASVAAPRDRTGRVARAEEHFGMTPRRGCDSA